MTLKLRRYWRHDKATMRYLKEFYFISQCKRVTRDKRTFYNEHDSEEPKRVCSPTNKER
jgi:hypothetical protein